MHGSSLSLFCSPILAGIGILCVSVNWVGWAGGRGFLACSRRSDSGERCEVKRTPLLFIAFFTLHRSPLSERLEQARVF